MAASEKARAKIEQMVGKAAQAAGRATGNHTLIAKGRAAQAAGKARETKESLKDTGRR
ncbi:MULTISPECIES: CsbD family protein [Streptomyces]|uniref:CsbD family protein n=1 Tax=Streptomyces TaxID=1883 RepID=UPI0029B90AE5|nr:CsbD family protein [Streptomyces sp. WI03-4A]MDX2593797.1 CsbD family protein [Streptomyces sp. WI03-4A]